MHREGRALSWPWCSRSCSPRSEEIPKLIRSCMEQHGIKAEILDYHGWDSEWCRSRNEASGALSYRGECRGAGPKRFWRRMEPPRRSRKLSELRAKKFSEGCL